MKVVVTQPYVPAYRIPLFNEIHREFASRGHEFLVIGGLPVGSQAARRDATSASWLVSHWPRSIGVGARRLLWSRVPREHSDFDVLVSELDVKNLSAWRAALARRRPVVLWGHGRAYVSSPPWWAERLKAVLSQLATAVMTYSPGGKDYLVNDLGVPADRVLAIGNATDVEQLRAGYLDAPDTPWRSAFAKSHGTGPHFLYVGGLDGEKRVPFLLDAAAHLTAVSAGSKLLVCGDGELRDQVLGAERAGQGVVYLGPRTGRDLGAVAAMTAGVWMPGRVGLVAMDAFALGLPLFTTDFPRHAPELELLPPEYPQVLPDDAARFAATALARVSDGKISRVRTDIDMPTIESVASKFVATVVGASRSRRSHD